MDSTQKPNPIDLDETHLFGMVPEAMIDEHEPSLASTLGVPLLNSKLSLRSSSPEDNDKSSGIGSTVSSITNADMVQQETHGKTNGDLFVPARNSRNTTPSMEEVDGEPNESESLQTVVIDIENEEGKC